MAFKVHPGKRVTAQADLVLAILKTPTRIDATFTNATLRDELARIGLSFTTAQITAIVNELRNPPRLELVNVP